MYRYPVAPAFFDRWRVAVASAVLAAVCVDSAVADTPAGETPAPTAERAPLAVSEPLRRWIDAGRPRTPDDLVALQRQVRRIVRACRPATVAIELDDSIGSGVIVSADGLVLTAGHVSVEPNREVEVRFPDNSRAAGLSLGIDHPRDSGLVRLTGEPPVDPATGERAWPFVPLAEVAAEEGDWVVALGQPNGFVPNRAPPVRIGRVLEQDDDALCTDATLVGGDSGGPLMNLRGELVGIHSRIGERLTSNYHVAVGAYQRGWDDLLAGRMFGVPEGEDPDDWRPAAGLAVRVTDDGLLVTQVFADTAAERAGVEVGDRIAEFAGAPVGDDGALRRLMRRQRPYDRTPLVVVRGDQPTTLELWLGRAPVDFPGSLLAEGR
ncbi:MAG: trypsin-like peptidase domain-containing protein [Planctomycetota bacterium]